MGHMRGVRNMGHAVRTQDGDSHGLDSAPRAKSPQGMARLPLLLTLGFVGLGDPGLVAGAVGGRV